ncbi:hypothetical protein BZA77DRAFT_254849 [Pyronema omphalodes]|nr:hypothetical protein BZA77DRAFT_254849 [Pyronema omphalodes]
MLKKRKTSVLVVGSGLAGLTAAHLLHNDKKQRYDVTIFEQGPVPSLSSASLSTPSGPIDIPMRSFTASYYPHLSRVLQYLHLPVRSEPFLFTFPSYSHPSRLASLPPRPSHRSWPQHIRLLAALAFAYAYFIFTCFFLPPSDSEDFGQWMKRVRLPGWFIGEYILPMMAAVATCDHAELLAFPAKDVVGYKRVTNGEPHVVVADGVGALQKQLLEGGKEGSVKIMLNRRVQKIQGAVQGPKVVTYLEDGAEVTGVYDKVVLAVTPDVVGSIYAPLKEKMSRIPTKKVEVVAIREEGREGEIILRSKGGETEARHCARGLVTVTGPLTAIEDGNKVIRRSVFTRVLRSVESRQVVKSLEKSNGDDGVFIVGGWCWDGMVLLEGCVRSAEGVARKLGVEVPW